MKWVWGILALFAVTLGSVLIWQRFGVETARHPEATKWLKDLEILRFAQDDVKGFHGTVLAVFGQAPEFSLTERSGESFSKSDLAGKPWIADFIFTSCAGQCPLMNLQMKKFQSEFGPETGFHFVSFTVDPERDTPEVLSQYAERYSAQKDRWFFLTGPREEANRILKEFFLSPVENPAMHSVRFILVDGEGQMRGYYDSSETASMEQLVRDAKLLLNS